MTFTTDPNNPEFDPDLAMLELTDDQREVYESLRAEAWRKFNEAKKLAFLQATTRR